MDKIEKVVIIGGGPAGLAAAVYNSRAFLDPLVIEGVPAGGQLMLTSEVENYPGFLSILGPELVATMKKHAEKFGTRFLANNVSKIDTSSKPFSIHLSGGDVIKTETILVATGASAKWLGLDSEQR
ncbi:MAG: FAD-dependent oxidoreductase, partial [Candidatus Roizmanbacteria bacterium]